MPRLPAGSLDPRPPREERTRRSKQLNGTERAFRLSAKEGEGSMPQPRTQATNPRNQTPTGSRCFSRARFDLARGRSRCFSTRGNPLPPATSARPTRRAATTSHRRLSAIKREARASPPPAPFPAAACRPRRRVTFWLLLLRFFLPAAARLASSSFQELGN